MPNQVVCGEIEIAAPPDTVFDALVDPLQLTRWFSERADVDVANGRYAFWGRFTPDGAGRSDERVSQVSAVPNERLNYRWSLYGCETDVLLALRPHAGGTDVVVRHSGIAFDTPWLLEMFWSVALENLRAWVERREEGLRHDLTTEQLGGLTQVLDIAATPETVFAALIEPAQLVRYLADDPVVEPEVGGRIDFGWHDDGPYRILTLDPPHRLDYAWRFGDGTPDSLVSWQLTGTAGRTRLTLVHTGFAADRNTAGYAFGWLDYLNRIRFMCEVGPSWRKPRIELLAAEEAARRAEPAPTPAAAGL